MCHSVHLLVGWTGFERIVLRCVKGSDGMKSGVMAKMDVFKGGGVGVSDCSGVFFRGLSEESQCTIG